MYAYILYPYLYSRVLYEIHVELYFSHSPTRATEAATSLLPCYDTYGYIRVAAKVTRQKSKAWDRY